MTIEATTWSLTHRPSASLEVHTLGVVDFDSALFLQQRLVYEISGRSDRLGGLLLCEHPPMITIGREGSRGDVLAEPRDITARQMEVRWLNRGGGSLVHAPGQLAAYPILPLDRLNVGLADFRGRLRRAVIGMCRELRIPTTAVSPQSSGISCRNGQFATVGAAVKSWVSYHGLFVNVCPDLELMRMVKSPSDETRVTSLAAQRQRATSMHSVRERLLRHLVEEFQYETYHVYSGHPLLRRTRRRVCEPA